MPLATLALPAPVLRSVAQYNTAQRKRGEAERQLNSSDTPYGGMISVAYMI